MIRMSDWIVCVFQSGERPPVAAPMTSLLRLDGSASPRAPSAPAPAPTSGGRLPAKPGPAGSSGSTTVAPPSALPPCAVADLQLDLQLASCDLGDVELFRGYPPQLLDLASFVCIMFMCVGVPGNLITVAALFKCRKGNDLFCIRSSEVWHPGYSADESRPTLSIPPAWALNVYRKL
ncbi:unnamed protein product [Bemisia tabaci]|uniref:Uncharacterized protein n=1 Tax=Bemisia tabaci TaxID=7038 RepID=A0A9P0A9M5_BEMTA|nr:unnamed protein product [Bemisia tabaci]